VEVTGWAHQRVSRAADEVHLAVLGTVVRIKPGWQDGPAARGRS
jgi:adenosyl cobinamide kinase/adenosyl cobinamide phosphate guanylyltransferase